MSEKPAWADELSVQPFDYGASTGVCVEVGGKRFAVRQDHHVMVKKPKYGKERLRTVETYCEDCECHHSRTVVERPVVRAAQYKEVPLDMGVALRSLRDQVIDERKRAEVFLKTCKERGL